MPRPLEQWERLTQQLDESLAGLSDEERPALADEITDGIKRNITERQRPGNTVCFTSIHTKGCSRSVLKPETRAHSSFWCCW